MGIFNSCQRIMTENSEKCNGTKMVIFSMDETTGKVCIHFCMKIMG
jgi:hypothetical protein